MTLADNGFGDLVSTENPFGKSTECYFMDSGKLARFTVETGDHAQAIDVLHQHLGHVKLSNRRWHGQTILALIKGGQQ